MIKHNDVFLSFQSVIPTISLRQSSEPLSVLVCPARTDIIFVSLVLDLAAGSSDCRRSVICRRSLIITYSTFTTFHAHASRVPFPK